MLRNLTLMMNWKNASDTRIKWWSVHSFKAFSEHFKSIIRIHFALTYYVQSDFHPVNSDETMYSKYMQMCQEYEIVARWSMSTKFYTSPPVHFHSAKTRIQDVVTKDSYPCITHLNHLAQASERHYRHI